jgi:lipoprotein-releasing system permease protein
MPDLIKTFAFERFLAFRYLRSKRREGFISVISLFSFLGIMIGVATLIIVMSVMNGFRQELLSRVLGINGHIGMYPVMGPVLRDYAEKEALLKLLLKEEGVDVLEIPLTEQEEISAESEKITPEKSAISSAPTEKKLSADKTFAQVIPIVEGQVMASYRNYNQGAMVRGIRAGDFQNRSVLKKGYSGEKLENFQGNKIILGNRLAMKMGVYIGDSVMLISPQGNRTAFGTIPRYKSYQVLGTFDSGMYEYDSNFIFMPLDEAQQLFMTNGAVSHLEVVLPQMGMEEKILPLLAGRLPADARAYDWKKSNEAFFNAIEVERNVMFLILTLIIVVAAFNMISGLIMMVNDKVKDIAILRTMGASKGSVMRVFLIDGAMVGFFGTLFGTVFGLLFCHHIESIRQFLGKLAGRDLFSAEIYFLSKLPAKVDTTEVLIVVAMALSLSFLATLYPSYKASKTDPVKALRYE